MRKHGSWRSRSSTHGFAWALIHSRACKSSATPPTTSSRPGRIRPDAPRRVPVAGAAAWLAAAEGDERRPVVGRRVLLAERKLRQAQRLGHVRAALKAPVERFHEDGRALVVHGPQARHQRAAAGLEERLAEP